jgi:LPXTG-site transpeptidase (sortase) family protein
MGLPTIVCTRSLSIAGLTLLGLTGCGVNGTQQSAPKTTIASPTFSASARPIVLVRSAQRASTTRPSTPPRKTTAQPKPPSSSVASAATEQRPRPMRLRLPSIQLNRPILTKPLKMDRKRKLESPKDTKSIGWYNAAGPLVLAGHVDSTAGPGVFYGLKKVKRGDTFEVDFADGKSVSYQVSQVSTFPKNKFPTDLVYRANDDDIRIVTCGGKFNRKTRHYEDNVIVVASPVT